MSDQQAPVEVTPKFWWDSKTIRFNAIVGALSLIGAIALFLLDSARAGLLPFEMDARWLLLIVGVINVVNLWLRSQTNQPVTRSKSDAVAFTPPDVPTPPAKPVIGPDGMR